MAPSNRSPNSLTTYGPARNVGNEPTRPTVGGVTVRPWRRRIAAMYGIQKAGSSRLAAYASDVSNVGGARSGVSRGSDGMVRGPYHTRRSCSSGAGLAGLAELRLEVHLEDARRLADRLIGGIVGLGDAAGADRLFEQLLTVLTGRDPQQGLPDRLDGLVRQPLAEGDAVVRDVLRLL